MGIQVGTGDGIEVGDELAHARDQGHFLEFSCGNQAFIEGADDRIKSSRGERCHV